MAKKWKYVRLTANVLGKGASGQQLVIGEEVSREMAEDWVERGLAVYSDSEECRVESVESGPQTGGPVALALEDATIGEVLIRAEELLAGKPHLVEAISLIHADLNAEYISMAEMARRVEVDAKEIQKAVDDGTLTRYEVDGGKKLLKADEALAAWEILNRVQDDGPRQDDGDPPAPPTNLQVQ